MANENLQNLPEDVVKMLESLPPDQQEKMKQQLSSMTPEQLKMMAEKMKTMTPEEREAMKKQRSQMTPEELAAMSQREEKQKAMQQKMMEMKASGKGGKPKANNFNQSLKRLLSYLGRRKGKLILVISSAVLATLLSLLSPFVIAKALDVFQDNVVNNTPFNYRRIGFLVLVLACVYLLNMLFALIQNRTMTSLTQATIYDMRSEVDKKLMKLPFSYFDSKQKGDILSRITNDIDNVGTSLQQSITQVVTSVLTITGCIVLMFIYSWKITLACILILALGLFASKKIMGMSQGYFREQWTTLGDLNGIVEETFSGMYVIKAFGCEKKKIDEFCEMNGELYNVSRKAQFLSSTINPASNMFNNLAYIVICIAGAFSFIKGTLSLGSISALIQYQKQYANPVTQMASVLNMFQSAVASAERVFELLDEAEEQETAEVYKHLDSVKGDVKFSHLQFGYVPGKLLMKDIDVDVKAGQMVAIVGPTGAGKTTLVNLLMRFYETNGGTISIDGMSTRDMTREDLRDIFGMVLQETWLYSGTIYENIAYGNKNATREQVLQAAKSAQVEFFFETMPDGYDTVINEDASNLSQGQKQLLTIARAMVADPKILILDEATSSVDTRTELMIQKAMANLLKGRTSFVIAHRLSTIKDADLILYMEQGNILEQGTHASLMEKGGKYAELYNSQFAKEEEEFHGLIYHDFESGIANMWKDLLEAFGKERGIPVKYVTGQIMGYEKALSASLLEDNPPALMKMRFGMLQKYKFLQDICESLDDTRASKDALNEMNCALSYDGRIIGLPYNVEGIGLIYNKQLMKKYFDIKDRAASVNSMEEISGQEELIALVEDVYKHREEIGVEGVFPKCAFAQNAEDQWKTHMMAMAIYYEALDKGERALSTFDFKYSENTRKLYDMFFKYAIGTPDEYSNVQLPESVKSFMTGEAPMMLYLHLIRNSYVRKNKLVTEEQLAGVVKDEDIGIIPLYFGHAQEKSQNIAVGMVWNHVVNRNAGEEQKKYAKEFLDWTVYSETGRRMIKELGYISPYKTITKADIPQEEIDFDVFDKMHDDSRDKLNFAYTIMPNGPFRNEYAANLLEYAKGNISWDEVCSKLKEAWTKAAKMNESNVKSMFPQL